MMQVRDKDIAEQKAALRPALRARLGAMEEAALRGSDARILRALYALPCWREARRIFAYWGVRREICTRGLVEAALAEGKPVLLPRILGRGHMDFAAYDGLPECVFGIPQPGAEAPAVSPERGDLILVPGLGYDREGYRLGWGGGYYDRLLAESPAYSLGLCRAAFLSETPLPREEHDRAVSAVLTEAELIIP